VLEAPPDHPQTADRPRVVLHVGSPKTGTTFLQRVLWDHRELLREEHGILYPGADYWDQFHAAVDLQGHFHGDPRPDLAGCWPALVEELRSWSGTAVVSHEVLAGAEPEDVRRALRDLDHAEVHVVLTARDLGRQLPSRWQEDVKHGARDTFEQWWARILERDEEDVWSRWFWRTTDPLDVLDRWGEVPLDRLHVVTVPRSGSPWLLWSRFCEVVGVDPHAADVSRALGSNSSLGVAEVEVYRRVNVALRGEMAPLPYHQWVKDVLAQEVLAARGSGESPTLPAPLVPAVQALAGGWVREIDARDVDVVGDLDELLPEAAAEGGPTPDGAREADVAEAAVEALAEVLERQVLGAEALEAERSAHEEQLRELHDARSASEDEAGRLRGELEEALEEALAQRDALAAEAARPRGVHGLLVRVLRRAPEPVRRRLLRVRDAVRERRPR